MRPALHRSFTFQSEDATRLFAAALAPLLGAGDTLLMQGGLGAGKTHFARSLIQARLAAVGMSEDVPSPTYTLVQTYSDGSVEIWHSDLYRLSGPDGVCELGLEDAFEAAICLVEWPDRLGDLAPPGALTLAFEMGASSGERRAVASSENPRWVDIFAALDAPDG